MFSFVLTPYFLLHSNIIFALDYPLIYTKSHDTFGIFPSIVVPLLQSIKLKVTRGPHETRIKVSRAALKNWEKKLKQNSMFIFEKIGQMA